MFQYDIESDFDETLAEIPAEYQDIFREALAAELEEDKTLRTDHEILFYLRERRADFQRGAFIRPDGRPGMLDLSPEAIFEQALPELVRDMRGEEDSAEERRRLFLKIGLFAGVVVVFLFLVFRARNQRLATDDEPTPTITVAVDQSAPTPALPEIAGVEESLQTIGGLGGALTIGRPSALELHYRASEEVIALAIDPSRTTNRGELRFDAATMTSENPVAVWLFGTVLNYAIGIPDSMVRNLSRGDQIILANDTGAALTFIVTETRQGSSYDTGQFLSQNRVGLTLFALPATASDDVSFALASYDLAGEATGASPTYAVGELFELAGFGELSLDEVTFAHTSNGDIRIVTQGAITQLPQPAGSPMLSLVAAGAQTPAVPLEITNDRWQATFILPTATIGQPLMAEFRALPANELALVRVGALPDLHAGLKITLTDAVFASVSGEIRLEALVKNPGPGAVYLAADFLQLIPEGGDANPILPGQSEPHLPTLLQPGETLRFQVTFPAVQTSVQVQIGTDRWALAAAPAMPAPPAAHGQ